MNLEELKKQCLIYDTETSAFYEDGSEVNIKTNFEDYVELAQVKFFGAYSYSTNKEYYLEVSKNRDLITQLLNEHSILVGYNSSDFDYPILINNGFLEKDKYVNNVDLMKILCAANFKGRDGFSFKQRGILMGYKFKSNSLKCLAETLGMEVQKGDIDYRIFQKDNWSESERQEILAYLKGDILATKGMFDKTWDYWKPFTEMISEKDVKNLSWIKSSIASLTYKSACHQMNTEPTYGEGRSDKEDKGGRVLLPKFEESRNVWYVDFSSLYPHIMCMFNLFSETTEDNVIAWHGNDLFKVKGYYDISYKNQLSEIVEKKLKERIELQRANPNDPMVYAIKIFLNSLYGAARSAIFEKIHTKNIGWDTCWLGQQIHEFTEKEMKEFGFDAIYGDTDSLMLVATDEEYNKRIYVEYCLKQIVKKIQKNVPFPVETFNIKIENYLEYMLFPFAEEPIVDEEVRKEINDCIKQKKELPEPYLLGVEGKKKVIRDTSSNEVVKIGASWVKSRRGKKKNYAYLYEKDGKLEIELVGLPIKKDTATPLGMKIFNEILKPLIIENKRAKFSKEFMDAQISEALKKKEILELLAVEFKIKPYDSYKIPKGKKEPSGIHAQISKGYFNGGDGVISLIKNNKVGKAGKGQKYCQISEALENKLTVDDLDLEKIYNELQPFILEQVTEIKEDDNP